jgi:hypothetical protein
MDNEQAKIVLVACRPGGQDAVDPHFTEALEQAGLDPELAAWFAEQREFDRAISAKVRAVPVPADLKAAILAGRRVAEPRPWWRRREWMAIAAAVVALLGGLIAWAALREETGFAAYRTDMFNIASSIYRVDKESGDVNELRRWLAENGGHREIAVPAGLRSVPSIGCSLLDWQGKKVTLICFRIGPAGPNDEVHLFVIDRADLPEAPLVDQTLRVRKGDWSVATWNRGNKVYLLAGYGDTARIKKFL